jgi:hypothetical protein
VTLGNRLVSGRARAVRCLLVWASGTTLLGGVARSSRPAAAPIVQGSLPELPLDRALVDLAALALLACLAWGWLALTATVVEALGEARSDVRGCGFSPRLPGGLRRLVLAGCGVALVSGLAQPALASSGSSRSHHDRGLIALVGLPLPDRATAPPSRHGAAARTRSSVVVGAGDCLWSIASRDLPPGARASDIAARWQAIYAANRAVIGPDPDLLEPGQLLRLPRKDPS